MVAKSHINVAMRSIGMNDGGGSQAVWILVIGGGGVAVCAPNFRLLVRLCFVMRCFAVMCLVCSHSAPTE